MASDHVEVPAVHRWANNAELIRYVAALGYLKPEWETLDATYGMGTFWKLWRPERLATNDLSLATNAEYHFSFTELPFMSQWFDAVVFDPPYKLNGRPDPVVDARYGVDGQVRWQTRMALIQAGVAECARVCAGNLLVKCQDQVCSGAIRWQTDLVTRTAEANGFEKVDRFDLIGHARPQPHGRRQVHTRGRGSTLLVFSRTGSEPGTEDAAANGADRPDDGNACTS